MTRAGFHSMPMDFAGNKFAPKVKAIDIDLSSAVGSSWLLKLWTIFNLSLSILDCLVVHAVGHVSCQWRKS